METLGYSLDALLVRARAVKADWNLAVNEQSSRSASSGGSESPTSSSALRFLSIDEPMGSFAFQPSAPTNMLEPIVSAFDKQSLDSDDITSLPAFLHHDHSEVSQLLDERVLDAEAQGLTGEHLERLRTMLGKYRDVFRLSFGQDAAVRVPPLEVRVRPGTQPAKCST
ncbi:hypothetical protein AC1031_008047 [Aphanomyces cochlioides]|nr:hypothetical protein AC1031_008047 [Aphanomyces cochlioides]